MKGFSGLKVERQRKYLAKRIVLGKVMFPLLMEGVCWVDYLSRANQVINFSLTGYRIHSRETGPALTSRLGVS